MTMRLRFAAAVILALALALPLLSVPVGLSETPRSYRWPLQQASGDWQEVILVLLAFLWPFAVLALRRAPWGRTAWLLTQLVEPPCAIFSSALILLVLSITIEFRGFLTIFFLPVSARTEIGTYVALAGNGLYLASWLWDGVASMRPRAHSQVA